MEQTTKLLSTLKRYLKVKGITYQNLAQELKLSEASVKRLFSEKSFSLKRLEEVCKVVDLDFYDLARMAKMGGEEDADVLTVEQEGSLAKNPKLLTFLYLLMSGWSPSLIVEEFQYSELESSQFLLELDRLALIELHPNNKVRLRVSKHIFWRQNGPIWQLYRKRIQEEFFDYTFDSPNERLVFVPGKLSDASLKTILKQMDKLVKQFEEIAEMEASFPLHERVSSGLLVAFRPWVLSLIDDLKKTSGPTSS